MTRMEKPSKFEPSRRSMLKAGGALVVSVGMPVGFETLLAVDTAMAQGAKPPLAPDLLAQSDPELWNAIRLENQRQEDHVELIASENYVSRAVLLAQGSAPLGRDVIFQRDCPGVPVF